MNRKLFLLLLLLTPFITVFGQNIVVKPYLQNAFPTSMTIMWESDASGNGEVHFGLDPFSLDVDVPSFSILGSGTSQIHAAEINALIPDTKYYYQVEMAGGQISNLYHFKTPSLLDSEEPTHLMAVSDMQLDGSHPNKFKEIIEQGFVPIIHAQIGPSLNDLDGILIPGDLVPAGGTYSQWKDYFFDKADSIFPYVPIYPVLGNHEYYGGGESNFIKYFTLPTNGVPSLSEQCWYKDISNVRIIGLDSNTGSVDQELQLEWLGDLLDATCNTEHIDFVFAQLHHPFKSELWTPGENQFTGKVIDSLEQFTSGCTKASIHFFGHTHAYSRGQSRDHKHLWMNVATAGGAIDNWGEFPNADYDEFVKSQDEYGFVMIDVEAGTEPRFTIKRYSRGDQDVIINNELRDELTIYKHAWPAAQPENLFPANGDTLASQCVKLKASQYQGLEDSIQASHWEIALGGNFVDSIVSTGWYQNENFYNEVNTQASDDLSDTTVDLLEKNKIYHWRVRYRNQQLDWSPWSEPTTFFLVDPSAVLSGNLVLNADAEDGTTHWVGDIESLTNGECGSVLPYAGSSNFGVGGICANESSVGIATQTIDLSAYSTEIAQGITSIKYGGFMRDYNGDDRPEIYVEIYDQYGLNTTSEIISNASAAWIYKESIVSIPVGSTVCRLVLKGIRNSGTDNDCYFDNLFLQVIENTACPTCFGSSNIDIDQDGFCDDVDCNDFDDTIYPGALEICDSKDNNCDGITEIGPIVTWTGTGGNGLWSDRMNWDQLMVPLACQAVVINSSATVSIDQLFACRGLEIGINSTLIVDVEGFLSINSLQGNTEPSGVIHGQMMINGRCDVQSSSNSAFEITGTLINTNKVNTFDINSESIIVRPGGRYENKGTTVLR